MENIKKYANIIFKGLVLLLAILFLLKNCSGCLDKVVPGNDTPNHDSIYKSEQKENAIIQSALKELNLLKRKNDSLEKLKPKIVYRYRTVYDSLIVSDTSCVGSLITLYNAFGELNDLNDTIIVNSKRRAEKDSILIASGNNKLATKQCRITNDSTYIDYLVKDSIPKVAKSEFKRGKRVGRVQGVIATLVAEILLFLGITAI